MAAVLCIHLIKALDVLAEKLKEVLQGFSKEKEIVRRYTDEDEEDKIRQIQAVVSSLHRPLLPSTAGFPLH